MSEQAVSPWVVHLDQNANVDTVGDGAESGPRVVLRLENGWKVVVYAPPKTRKEKTMSEPKDGGPAFPSHGDNYTRDEPGMSLRDWFAGQAIAEIIVRAHGGWQDDTADAIAATAYAIADAMLRARQEGGGDGG
jgi:hypothetical protein